MLDAADSDRDGVLDLVDNCPLRRNASQSDRDGDGIGNKCDPDIDGDDLLNDIDNCPGRSNPFQKDHDLDGRGNRCDPDDDNDTVKDRLDAFRWDPTEWDDTDRDRIGDNTDNCPAVANRSQKDRDADGLGNPCDPDDDNDGVDDLDNYKWNPKRQ